MLEKLTEAALTGDGFLELYETERGFGVTLYLYDELSKYKATDDPRLPMYWHRFWSAQSAITLAEARKLSRLERGVTWSLRHRRLDSHVADA